MPLVSIFKIIKDNEINFARQWGEDKGKLESELEIAKKLLKKNMPIAEISDVTGLTEDEVESLK
jgi:predicted transposase/invertase (TIGR01784 family)